LSEKPGPVTLTDLAGSMPQQGLLNTAWDFGFAAGILEGVPEALKDLRIIYPALGDVSIDPLGKSGRAFALVVLE